MLEFVDSGSYFVQDENNCIYPWLQDPDPEGKKSTEPTESGSASLPDPISFKNKSIYSGKLVLITFRILIEI